MRFFWLALAIAFPVFWAHFLAPPENAQQVATKDIVNLCVSIVAEVLLISFTIVGFSENNRRKARERNLMLKSERDDDIKKWRDHFYKDTVNIYDTQEETLKRAHKLQKGDGDKGKSEQRSQSSKPSQDDLPEGSEVREE